MTVNHQINTNVPANQHSHFNAYVLRSREGRGWWGSLLARSTCTNERTNELMNQLMSVRASEQSNQQRTNERANESMNERTNERTNERKSE